MASFSTDVSGDVRSAELARSCGHGGRVAVIPLASLYQDLSERGWSCRETGLSNESELVDAVHATARDLGVVIEGRRGLYVERLVSLEEDKAPARSLSAQFGRSEFPYHVDMAHFPAPCRYIVLGCGSAKEKPAATLIQSIAEMKFSQEEVRCLHSGVFLVRNGRRSFYASVLSGQRRFFRWDPGCMLAKDDYAHIAQAAIERELMASNGNDSTMVSTFF